MSLVGVETVLKKDKNKFETLKKLVFVMCVVSINFINLVTMTLQERGYRKTEKKI